jgi:hypothetical protein
MNTKAKDPNRFLQRCQRSRLNGISVPIGVRKSQRPLAHIKQVAVVLGGNRGADSGIGMRCAANAIANKNRKYTVTNA